MARKTETQEQAALERRRTRRFWLGIVALFALGLLALEVADLLPEDTFWPLANNHDTTQAQTILNPAAPLAPFFMPQVTQWETEIQQWANTYQVNPNVIAIVIQIESCGDPVAMSGAGALGLMQVMPFHFDNGENMLNPDTNVLRGMTVFYECLTVFAEGDLGMALACYNGGPGVTQRSYNTWAAETQYYYQWATGLWGEVVEGLDTSETLVKWLEAGGQSLCDRAAQNTTPAVPVS